MFERCFECRQWFFIINGGCTGLFGQFFPAVIEHERDMEIAQWGSLERLGEQYLPRRVVYQIRTAHDVGDALVKIVNDDGTESFLPNGNIFLAALIAAAVLLLALAAVFRLLKKEEAHAQ